MATKNTKLRPINLGTTKSAQVIGNGNEYWKQLPYLEDLANGRTKTESIVTDGKFNVFRSVNENLIAFVQGSLIYVYEAKYYSDNIGQNLTKAYEYKKIPDALCGYLAKHGSKQVVLVNGDDNGRGYQNYLVGEGSLSHMPTISFQLLNRFYDEKEQVVQKKLASGELHVVDFSADSLINLDKKIVAQLRKFTDHYAKLSELRRKIGANPPEVGYTLINYAQWHRAASVLFRDNKANFSILVGQDEGTYFGVELQDNPKSLKAAFDSLIPEAAKGKAYQRQGEWFAVERTEKEVPKIEECAAEFDKIVLPREGGDSNRHYLKFGEGNYDGRISMDGTIYGRSGSVTHDDHNELDFSGWVSFHRNTAVRSYSQEGVD